MTRLRWILIVLYLAWDVHAFEEMVPRSELPSYRFSLNDFGPYILGFWDDLSGAQEERQVSEFKRRVLDYIPKLVAPILGAPSDRAIAEYLRALKPHLTELEHNERQLPSALKKACTIAAEIHHDFACSGRVYAVPSFFEYDVRVVASTDEPILLLGIDTMAQQYAGERALQAAVTRAVLAMYHAKRAYDLPEGADPEWEVWTSALAISSLRAFSPDLYAASCESSASTCSADMLERLLRAPPDSGQFGPRERLATACSVAERLSSRYPTLRDVPATQTGLTHLHLLSYRHQLADLYAVRVRSVRQTLRDLCTSQAKPGPSVQ